MEGLAYAEERAGGVRLSFIDSSAFLYAFLASRSDLLPEVSRMKGHAQAIIRRIQEGEPVTTSVVHVSEVANILEKRFPLDRARNIVSSILLSDNVSVSEVDNLRYEAALSISERHMVGLNDALTYSIMRENGITKIYSFDNHFDLFPGITRLTE